MGDDVRRHACPSCGKHEASHHPAPLFHSVSQIKINSCVLRSTLSVRPVGGGGTDWTRPRRPPAGVGSLLSFDLGGGSGRTALALCLYRAGALQFAVALLRRRASSSSPSVASVWIGWPRCVWHDCPSLTVVVAARAVRAVAPPEKPPPPSFHFNPQQVKYELDLECEICAACGHVVSDRALHSAVQWSEDGAAHGTFLGDQSSAGHLAAARIGLSFHSSGGGGGGVARKMFRDERAQHLEDIAKAVNFATGQLKLSRDAAADAKLLVIRAAEGRWGEGEWTTLLVGACVYVACRQNALPLSMRDVAAACQLDVFAMGRVYTRLRQLYDVRVPPLDPGAFVARAAAAIPELNPNVGGRVSGGVASPTNVNVSLPQSIRVGVGGHEADDAGGAVTPTGRRVRPGRVGGTTLPGSALPGNAPPSPLVGMFSPPGSAFTPRGTAASRGEKEGSRGAHLAPLVGDAKSLLAFLSSRGVSTGRHPMSLVAAALVVAAQVRGVRLAYATAAVAARASVEATRVTHVLLEDELVGFARTFEWGEAVTRRTLDGVLPVVVALVAGVQEEERRRLERGRERSEEDAHRSTETATAGEETEWVRRHQRMGKRTGLVSRCEGMPLSFRAAEAARAERRRRVARAREVTLASVSGGGQEVLAVAAAGEHVLECPGRPSGAESHLALALRGASNVTATSGAGATRVRVKRKLRSRGGVRRARGSGKKMFAGVWDTCVDDAPETALSFTTGGLRFEAEQPTPGHPRQPLSVAASLRPVVAPDAPLTLPPPSLPAAPVAVKPEPGEDVDVSWGDVMLQQLMLAGVPDRLLLEEEGLYVDEEAVALAAARRVRERFSAETNCDVLLGRGPGGAELSAEAVEKADKEAIASIPDAEITPLLRTPAETAVMRAMMVTAEDGDVGGRIKPEGGVAMLK